MNALSRRRIAVQALAVVVALAAVLTSGAPAQSLGEVARKEEARRKGATSTAKPAGKVYTNEDLKGAPAAATTSPAQPSSPASGTPSTAAPSAPDTKPAEAKPADGKTADVQPPKADAKPAGEQKDEAYWRKKRQTLQESLDRSKTFADALQSRINGLTADFSSRDDPAQRTVVANERQKALTELDRVKKEIVQQTKALDDLQEEARKSGVPAGWLR